jgi:hypothetical protein
MKKRASSGAIGKATKKQESSRTRRYSTTTMADRGRSANIGTKYFITMKSIRIVAGLIVLGAMCICFQGCVTGIRAANSGVTTLPNFIIGNIEPLTVFTTKDVIRFYVNITWDDVTQEAGQHAVVWNWYKEGKLVGHRENERAYLKGAPNTRFATQPASALGVGHFKAECLIDGKQIAVAEFDIKSAI